jgi:type II secretory pathway pseudopilin PulG
MAFFKKNRTDEKLRGGYTIIELVVAVGLFVIVALISSSAFLGVVASNRKTLAMRTVMDNLKSAIESMSRDMKTGSMYHCGSGGAIDTTNDCSSGSAFLALEGQNGDSNTSADQIVYQLGSTDPNCPSSEQICKSIDGGASFFAMTAPPPELHVTGLAFRVFGSSNTDTKQPRIVIVILGYAGANKTESIFDIETTLSQRNPDLI